MSNRLFATRGHTQVFFLSLLPGIAFCQAPVGQTQVQRSGRTQDVVLKASDLTVSIKATSHRLAGLHVGEHVDTKTLDIPEAFVIVLKDKSILRSTEMLMTPPLDQSSVAAQHHSAEGSHSGIGAEVRSCWNFTPKQAFTRFHWCVIVLPGTGYLRQELTISAEQRDLPVAEVRMLEFADPSARVAGTVKGSPVVSGEMFFGFEHPLSTSSVTGGRVVASLFRDLPLKAGQNVRYSSVIGTSRPGQLRRDFLAYLENERPRRYRPFLHYNSWFDLGYENRFDEAGALDRINAFGEQLADKRGVQLDSFLFDDGWDDPNTLWNFNPGFPNGFAKVEAAAAKYHAGIGVWLSPWGGYAEQKSERIAYGTQHGYEILNGGNALSGPKYYQQFEKTCLDMIDRYNVNQFKFDGTGNAETVFPGSAFDSDFDAAIHLIERLRKEKPGIFINLTTGTTPSPFWLFYADSIWRGGDDTDFAGEGTPRQRWITYRDAQTYRNIVRAGPLFPLNSLMLHGIVYAKQAKDLEADPKDDFADEVRSYFGTGTQLQEMYITPSLMTATNWDTLAAAARWSRAHAATLKDVHWIGGDPSLSQVYGWAAWRPQEGILTLRNPSSRPQSFDIDISKVFELPEGAPATYSTTSLWTENESRSRVMRIGELSSIRLAPFEVLTIVATPNP
jgi:hypothetical protein